VERCKCKDDVDEHEHELEVASEADEACASQDTEHTARWSILQSTQQPSTGALLLMLLSTNHWCQLQLITADLDRTIENE
jgi:hypothetical protein